MTKSCGNCARVHKYMSNGKERWACEEEENSVGMPVDCYPPHDKACKNWTDNPSDVGKIEDALREFIDNYWNYRAERD